MTRPDRPDLYPLVISITSAYARFGRRLKSVLKTHDPETGDRTMLAKAITALTRATMVEIGLDTERLYGSMLLDGVRQAGVRMPVLPGRTVHELFKSSPIWKAYAGMNQRMNAAVVRDIEQMFEGPDRNVDRLASRLVDDVRIEERRATTIARTETQAVQNHGRVLGYQMLDPMGRFRYKWGGKDISTTCDACKWVRRNVPEGGVRLEDLRLLVKEATDRFYPHLIPRDFQVHPNDRCFPQVVRVTDGGEAG